MSRPYRRLDEWVRSLSRPRYGVLAGTLSAVTMLLVGALLRESMVVEAVALGVSTAVFYVWVAPDDES
ncbi:hypothetical protein [Halopelagius fulvigenes]|uniref:Uncharacterized protein n=1 Tax=Halopelagius fulvigenes TaxID=1198324 RepID=A0ABD5U262_9EURY